MVKGGYDKGELEMCEGPRVEDGKWERNGGRGREALEVIYGVEGGLRGGKLV